MEAKCPLCRVTIMVGFVKINGYCPSCSKKLLCDESGNLSVPKPESVPVAEPQPA